MKIRCTVHSASAKAMEWLGKLDCMENALESPDITAEKRESLENRRQWIRHGLNTLSEEERQILLWITDGCSVEEMCEMTAREKSSLYLLRKRAIQKFTVALFGRMR